MFTGLILFIFISLSYSTTASISTLNSNQISANSSYRNFLLRQYFIDLLNISHASLVRSMIYENTNSNVVIRRKRFHDDSSNIRPLFTLQSRNCLIIDQQVQSTFLWSHSIESLASIELIYHIDSMERKPSSLPLQIKFKHPRTFSELLTVDSYLQFDGNRDFYSINLFEYFMQLNQQPLIIESYLVNETCRTSHSYIIISSRNHSKDWMSSDSSSATCRLKQIQIKFEDLGLAYLIIRPREYTFTYCDGRCSVQSSMHAIVQSIVNRQNSNIPQLTCVPAEFADDNFLLRQMDGTMEIYPIRDVIVKRCTCL